MYFGIEVIATTRNPLEFESNLLNWALFGYHAAVSLIVICSDALLMSQLSAMLRDFALTTELSEKNAKFSKRSKNVIMLYILIWILDLYDLFNRLAQLLKPNWMTIFPLALTCLNFTIRAMTNQQFGLHLENLFELYEPFPVTARPINMFLVGPNEVQSPKSTRNRISVDSIQTWNSRSPSYPRSPSNDDQAQSKLNKIMV
jgi:hypothetical protein